MSDLKPGDKALVMFGSPCGCAGNLTGTIVVVRRLFIADPGSICLGCRRSVAGSQGAEVDADVDSRPICMHAARLVRIPPDDEAKRLFRETEKPREVDHA